MDLSLSSTLGRQRGRHARSRAAGRCALPLPWSRLRKLRRALVSLLLVSLLLGSLVVRRWLVRRWALLPNLILRQARRLGSRWGSTLSLALNLALRQRRHGRRAAGGLRRVASGRLMAGMRSSLPSAQRRQTMPANQGLGVVAMAWKRRHTHMRRKVWFELLVRCSGRGLRTTLPLGLLVRALGGFGSGAGLGLLLPTFGAANLARVAGQQTYVANQDQAEGQQRGQNGQPARFADRVQTPGHYHDQD